MNEEVELDNKDIATPSRTRALLDKYGFNFKETSAELFDRCEYWFKIISLMRSIYNHELGVIKE